MRFDVRQTNIAKGVALVLLLWHHLFYNTPENNTAYSSLMVINGFPVEALIADVCKVCVAVFLILSGYGVHKSYVKRIGKSTKKDLRFDLSFTGYRLLSLFAPYWIIYLIFVPLGFLFGKDPIAIYNSNLLEFLKDITGLTYLFDGFEGNTMNQTWWFMSIIAVFYLGYTLLHRIMDHSPELVALLILCFSFIPFTLKDYPVWLFCFALGAYASKRNLFERIESIKLSSFVRIAFCLSIVVLLAFCRLVFFPFNLHFDFLLGFFVILLSFLGISKIPFLNRVFEELGKKSGEIFMFHTFIYLYYFHDFFYFFKYPVIILLVLLTVCYFVAWLIQKLMTLSGVDRMLKQLSKA